MNTKSNLADEAFEKLDGVWSVQLFFRSLPYYAYRANHKDNDPYKNYDFVLSENLPTPKLPIDVEDKLNIYTKQLWAMSIVYVEAILEHYFFGQLNNLSTEKEKLPRQASLLFERLQDLCSKKYGVKALASKENTLQLYELTETRHLWVHRNGIVDKVYLERTNEWWQSRQNTWHEEKPTIGDERILSETYIKSNIYFSKVLIAQVEENLSHIEKRG